MASRTLHESYSLYITSDAYVFDPTDGPSHQSRRLLISRRNGDIVLSQPGEGPLYAQDQLVVYGIMGILSLATSDFLVVITGREARGRIDGHAIYLATDFKVLPIAPPSSYHLLDHPVERHLQKLVERHLHEGVFWFSHGWDLTRRLQSQASVNPEGKAVWELADDRFFWNKYLHSRFIDISTSNPQQDLSPFILPVIYGSFDLRPAHINRMPFLMCLISRRSRYRAGTRYFARGLDQHGHAANFNETEQLILTDASPLGSIPSSYTSASRSAVGGGFGAVVENKTRMSFVQTRGSAPIGFAEINTLRYVPDLVIMSTEEMSRACKLHFQGQVALYGKQLLVNLVNSKGREKAVKDEYERKVAELTKGTTGAETMKDDLKYVYFDFHKECSKMRFDRIEILVDQLVPDLKDAGYFHQSISSVAPLKIQTGVVRSNCMDCLDRTNVTQAAVAKWSLTQQLRAAGILTEKDRVDDHPEFMHTFRHMWADHADYISRAYSGTPALKTDFTRTGKRSHEGLLKDFWSSVTRYGKNNFLDGERQDAFDLFTGAWIAHGGPARATALITDTRPLRVRSMPYVAFFALLLMGSALSFSGAPGYIIATCALVFAVSLFYIFSHGIEYVNWPKLNPPIESIFYEGPGFKTVQHGRGKEFRWIPVPRWVKIRSIQPFPKVSTPVLHKLEEIEMGTNVASKARKRVA
ncbi:hypothetical protein FRB90_000734 [Tulasnella sp. 427]|nr:hypothetical protein FRB90_000734 [Tulasnella sp. 427]